MAVATPKKKNKGGRKPGTSNKMFGLPVVEAEHLLTIPLLQVDIEEAEKMKPDGVNDQANFLCCVIAEATTRVCGADRVAILRRHAYVAFPGDGHTNRYVIDERSRDVLERWDRGERVVEGIELRLRPPAKTQTRDAIRKRHQRVMKAGGYKKTDRKQRKSDPLDDTVRNGNMVRWS